METVLIAALHTGFSKEVAMGLTEEDFDIIALCSKPSKYYISFNSSLIGFIHLPLSACIPAE